MAHCNGLRYVNMSKDTNVPEGKTAYMKRDLQKRHEKETLKSDLFAQYPYLRYGNMSKETNMHEKRPTYTKRDLH